MCEDKCCGHIRSKKEIHPHYIECGPIQGHRHFLSKEEETEMLEKYMEELEKEIKGVKQRIQKLKG